MPRLLSALILGAAAMPTPAADFPPPSQLPSNPGLPDVLTAFDGKTVSTKDEWENVRRPELKALFQHYMYGKYPAVAPKVGAAVLFEDAKALDGKATLREVALTVADGAPPIRVLVAVPNERSGPVPVFVGLNFHGNHTLTADPRVKLPDGWVYPNGPGVKANRAGEAGRGQRPDEWPLDLLVSRGYAVATAYNGDVIPDDPKARGGLADLLMPAGAADPSGTAAVMSWAWGVHRIVDYVSALPEIDPKRVAAFGHSRLGKTALVAAAFDDRIAVGFPHQAGCGGTAPSRTSDPKAESVKRITASFPHWFCGNFTMFADDTSKLPFDQNGLVAVCAPRPVLFTNATGDQWANPTGQFEILKAATPAYRLLGVDGIAADAMPPEGKLIDSRLGYWIRPGKHETNREDWAAILAFADKWLR